MNADVYLAKGHSHNICEDYGIVDIENQLMIVADGCSTAKYSDIAARILTHSARNTIINNNKVDYDHFASEILMSSMIASKVMNLEDLLSTLILTFVKNGKLYTYVYGDGHYVFKYKSQIELHFKISYSQNAPNYLWYRSNYKKYNIDNADITLEINDEKYTLKRDEPIFLTSSVKDLEYVAIFTDGIESFTLNKPTENSTFNTKITDKDVIKHLLDFRSTNGDFVIRRMKRFLKQTQLSGFIHDDDIACAVMYFGATNDKDISKNSEEEYKY